MWRPSEIPKSFLKSVWTGLFFLLMPLAALAEQSVSLNWNPSSDPAVTGYKIYYGTASQNYSATVDFGNVTNAVLSGLTEGATYFFAATTYDAAGDESDFSNEATFGIPDSNTNSVPTNPPVVVPPVIPPVTNPPPVVTNDPPPVTNPPVVISNPPTLNQLANITLNQNGAAQSVVLAGISSGLAGNALIRVTATSSNPSLIKPVVNYASPKSTGTINLKPGNATGSALITVTVNNGGKNNNIISKTFTVTIVPVIPPSVIARLAQMPKIARQLTNVFALGGRTISLTTAATGRAPLRYQWKFNGKPLVNANGATLTLKNVSASQAGLYSVTVSNPLGSTNSATAQVQVYSTTAATLNSVPAAANGNFRLQIAGVPTYNYVVEASTDMIHWSAIQTNTAPFVLEDADTASYGQRFYRSYCTIQ